MYCQVFPALTGEETRKIRSRSRSRSRSNVCIVFQFRGDKIKDSRCGGFFTKNAGKRVFLTIFHHRRRPLILTQGVGGCKLLVAAGEGRDDKEAKVRRESSCLLLLAILKSRSANVPLVRVTLMLSIYLSILSTCRSQI